MGATDFESPARRQAQPFTGPAPPLKPPGTGARGRRRMKRISSFHELCKIHLVRENPVKDWTCGESARFRFGLNLQNLAGSQATFQRKSMTEGVTVPQRRGL